MHNTVIHSGVCIGSEKSNHDDSMSVELSCAQPDH